MNRRAGLLVLCLGPVLMGCQVFDTTPYPGTNMVSQVTSRFITAIEPIG